jgi:hypothetical protein
MEIASFCKSLVSGFGYLVDGIYVSGRSEERTEEVVKRDLQRAIRMHEWTWWFARFDYGWPWYGYYLLDRSLDRIAVLKNELDDMKAGASKAQNE